MPEPHLLANDFVIGESARWHDGRAGLSNRGAQRFWRLSIWRGSARVVTRVPTALPFSIDWLSDGQLLVVAGPEQRLLQQPDGSLIDHADMSGLPGGLNKIWTAAAPSTSTAAMTSTPTRPVSARALSHAITPDGIVQSGRRGGLPSRTGWAVTDGQLDLDHRGVLCGQADGIRHRRGQYLDNRRTFVPGDVARRDLHGSRGRGPVDPAGTTTGHVARLAEGGAVLDRVPLGPSRFRVALGGPGGHTLFMLSADWHMGEDFMDNLKRLTEGPHTGQLHTTTVAVPSAGFPNHS